MAKEKSRPLSPQEAPDPARSYERAQPAKESGMGRLDNNKAVPTNTPDKMHQAVKNKQSGSRQINGQDPINQQGGPAPEQPDHSMKDEEPMGWDQAPTGATKPENKRHPRTDGKGGTK